MDSIIVVYTMPESESISDLPSTDVFGPFNSDSDVNQWIDDMQSAHWPGKFLITGLQDPPGWAQTPDATDRYWTPIQPELLAPHRTITDS